MPETPKDRFKPATRDVVARAKASVTRYKHAYITPEHLFLGILDVGGEPVLTGLRQASATPEQLRELLERHLRPGDFSIPEDQLGFSERAKRVVETAREESARAKADQIGPEHLLLGLLQVQNTVAGAVLRAADLNDEKVRAVLK